MQLSWGYKYYSAIFIKSALVCFIFLYAPLSVAQQIEFVPKSKKEIEKEKQFEILERKRISTSGIYSVTSVRFNYRFGKVEKVGTAESTIRYNNKGDKIREITYNPADGKVLATSYYRHDKNGNLIEESVKKDDASIKTIHRYNSRNNKIETVKYKADGTIDRKLTFVYDDVGLLLETIGKLDDGRVYMRDSYLYDGQGNIIEFKNTLKRITSSYDSQGNIESVLKYLRYFKARDTVQYNISERYIFEYNNLNYLIEMRSYKPDSSIKSRTQYIRNEKGMLLEEKEFSADGKLLYSRNLKYDKQQNLVTESGTDRALKFKNSYKYDSHGNKFEMTSYDQLNEPVSVTKYTFGRYGTNVASPNLANPAPEDSLFDDEEEPLNNDQFFQLLGSRIIASDGTYLGMVLADTASPQSIINAWGQYGLSQSPTSIFNPSSPYGGDNGIFSPFNHQSPSPPSIYKDGKFFTYLTDNDSYQPRSAPHRLVVFLKTLANQK